MRICYLGTFGGSVRGLSGAIAATVWLAVLANGAVAADIGDHPTSKNPKGVGTAPIKALEVITNSIGMKLVLLPAGVFSMGADESATDSLNAYPYAIPKWVDDELPTHDVQIARPFYMGQHEVTLGQFLKFYHAAHYKADIERNTEPSWGYKDGRLVQSKEFRPWAPGWAIEFDHPAVFISWNDAVAFCQWLSKQEGLKYRLPTEAEWEYACRGGTNTRYAFGNDPEDLVHYANGADQDRKTLFPTAVLTIDESGVGNSKVPFPYLTKRDGYAWTAPVGKFQPNAFGLYDMHGNAWEWCSDVYDAHAYLQPPTSEAASTATGTNRVIRGGAFNYNPFTLRSADRNNDEPSHCDCSHGFRIVCER